MPSYRYYKLHGISVAGGFFQISDFNLTNGGTRVGGATLTASSAPDNPPLSNFDDASTGTQNYWDATIAEGGGFYVRWDFGSATPVDGCKLAGHNEATYFPSGFTVSGSADGSTWSELGVFSGLSYPGNYTYTSVLTLADAEVISGTVLDDAGDPCARTVRLYNRSTGALAGSTTSNASTGAFSFSVESGTYYAVVLDDDAGTQHNALIFDRVESVAS